MQNKYFYFRVGFLILIIGVVLILIFVKPIWIGRFIAVAYACWFPVITLLPWGLNPWADFLDPNSQVAKHGDQQRKRTARLVSRFFWLFMGILFLVLSVPVAQDAAIIFKKGYSGLVTIEGEVVDTNIFMGTSFINQSVSFQKIGESRVDSYSLIFCSYRMEKGNTYRLMVTPHAKLILDEQRINSSKGS